MTVSSTTNRAGPYTGNGATTSFAYGFRILASTHIQVIKTISGVESIANTSEYTVTGVGAANGGSVVFGTAPASGVLITILRSVPFTQTTDLENQGAYYAETVEAAFDAAVMRDQQLSERLDRAVVIPPSSDTAQLDGLVEDILRIADSADNIDTVAGIAANVTTVAGVSADVTTVAGVSANVTTVAGVSAAVSTVAGIDTEVAAVAGNATNINTVAGNTANVTTVAGISSNVTTVAGVASDVTTVATNLADVTNFADVYQGPKVSDPSLRNDGSALQAGDLYFNTTDDFLRVYNGAAWQATTQQPLEVGSSTATGDGSTVAFTLPRVAGSVNNVFAKVGGVIQDPADYAVSGTTITFDTAPGSGVAIELRVIATVSQLNEPADGSVTTAKLDASTPVVRGDIAQSLTAAQQGQARANIGGDVLGGFRNKLINPLGTINQRGYVSGAATSSANQYTLDRWRVVTSGQNLSWTESAGVRTMTAPAGGVEQVIEGSSFLSGTHVLNWEGTATATVDGVSVSKGGTFALTGGTNCTVRFSNGTFSKPQLEVGSSPSSFSPRHIQQELALCQRYYAPFLWTCSAVATAGSQDLYQSFNFPKMRVAPSVTKTSGTFVNCADPSGPSVTDSTYSAFVRSAGAGSLFGSYTVVADAEL